MTRPGTALDPECRFGVFLQGIVLESPMSQISSSGRPAWPWRGCLGPALRWNPVLHCWSAPGP
jgi:hypothetical protein